MDAGAIGGSTDVLAYMDLKKAVSGGEAGVSILKKALDVEKLMGAEIAAMLLKGVTLDLRA